MGADSSTENTLNAPEFICPICLPKHKSLEFWRKKASMGVRSTWGGGWPLWPPGFDGPAYILVHGRPTFSGGATERAELEAPQKGAQI